MPKEMIGASAENIGQMLERCAQLECNVCSHEEREQGEGLLRKFSLWWIDAETREQLHSITIISEKPKTPKLQNTGISFLVSPEGSDFRIPICVYQLQHEQRPEVPKAGPHFSFQFPHGDIGKRSEDLELVSAINKLWHPYREKVEHLAVKSGASILPGAALGQYDFLKRTITEYARQMTEVFQKHLGA